MKTHTAIATLALLVAFFAAPSPALADYAAGKAAFDRGDYLTALDEWEPLARAGDAGGQYGMGLLSMQLEEKRPAFIWFREAGRQSHPVALAVFHVQGWTPVANPKAKAKCLYKAAARSGYAFGQAKYAASIIGNADPYNPDALSLDFEPYYWLERAAAQGDPSGQFLFSGVLLGNPIIGDNVTAYIYLILSANEGDEAAIDLLAERRKEARHFRDEREDLTVAERLAAEWRPVKEEPRFIPLKDFEDCLP